MKGCHNVSERFFLETPPAGSQATLRGDEARHLARVMRAAVGDQVELFDGAGHAWNAAVRQIGRAEVELELLGDGTSDEDHQNGSGTLTIAAALPKGDRQKWMVEKLTELGCRRLIPLVTTRGVAEATPSAIARLTRASLEACKQCRRNRLLAITEPTTLAAVLAEPPAGTLRLLADASGQPAGSLLASRADDCLVLIGPEGGFTEDERAAALAAGFQAVCLAPHILRVETAAVALAAVAATRAL